MKRPLSLRCGLQAIYCVALSRLLTLGNLSMRLQGFVSPATKLLARLRALRQRDVRTFPSGMTSAAADLDRYLASSALVKARAPRKQTGAASIGDELAAVPKAHGGNAIQLLVPSNFHHGVLGPHDKCFLEGGSSIIRARSAR